MKQAIPRQVILIGGVFTLLLASFLSFSYSFYPFFNSDAALAVLMAYDYRWPEDVYCWGQDRGGTPEMMLAHGIIRLFNSDPLLTASIIHFLLLIMGLGASFHFVKTTFARIILGALWFFPSWFFTEFVVYQFGIQFSMLLTGLVCLDKSMQPSPSRLVWLSLGWIFLIVNCWVLDLGIISVVILAGFIVYRQFFKNNDAESRINSLFTKPALVVTLIAIAAGTGFILFAKDTAQYAATQFNEFTFNSFAGILESVKKFSGSWLDQLLFRGEISESIFIYLGIGVMVLLIDATAGKTDLFRSYFLWNAVAGVLILLIAKQAIANGMPARYFAGFYFSFVMYALMSFEAGANRRLPVKIVLSLFAACSVYSSVYEHFLSQKLKPMVSNFKSLHDLKPVGIIGSYWHSYVFGAMDPEKIFATPHDAELVRNRELALRALQQEKIIVVKHEWMTNYPDTLKQFGTILIRRGEPFHLGTYITWEEVNEVDGCYYELR